MSIGLAGMGAALGIALLSGKAMESMARQPEVAGMIRTLMIIGIAFVEAIALYALIVSFILITKG